MYTSGIVVTSGPFWLHLDQPLRPIPSSNAINVKFFLHHQHQSQGDDEYDIQVGEVIDENKSVHGECNPC